MLRPLTPAGHALIYLFSGGVRFGSRLRGRLDQSHRGLVVEVPHSLVGHNALMHHANHVVVHIFVAHLFKTAPGIHGRLSDELENFLLGDFDLLNLGHAIEEDVFLHMLFGFLKEAIPEIFNFSEILRLIILAGITAHPLEMIGLGACALFHDNALTEAFSSEWQGETHSLKMKKHCIVGEENVSSLPFPVDTKGFILYHHEFMDDSGVLGVNPLETPVGAQLIAVADTLDAHAGLWIQKERSVEPLKAYVRDKRGTFFSTPAADALLSVLDHDLLARLRDENLDAAFGALMPEWEVELSPVEMMRVGTLVARITDYKSHFTAKHSIQIANRSYLMARYYGMDDETCARVYLAATLHDIGKLITPTNILEKQGKLTPEEFEVIKAHVYWSYIMLKDVGGLREVCRWAVCHHRKLDNRGCPDLPGDFFPLDFTSRLLACVDIYQAVRETRPYHAGRTHQETMDIMWKMADKGEIDKDITRDLDRQMVVFTEDDGAVPAPLGLLPKHDGQGFFPSSGNSGQATALP